MHLREGSRSQASHHAAECDRQLHISSTTRIIKEVSASIVLRPQHITKGIRHLSALAPLKPYLIVWAVHLTRRVRSKHAAPNSSGPAGDISQAREGAVAAACSARLRRRRWR